MFGEFVERVEKVVGFFGLAELAELVVLVVPVGLVELVEFVEVGSVARVGREAVVPPWAPLSLRLWIVVLERPRGEPQQQQRAALGELLRRRLALVHPLPSSPSILLPTFHLSLACCHRYR